MDNLAMSSSSQSDVAHAPSIGFGRLPPRLTLCGLLSPRDCMLPLQHHRAQCCSAVCEVGWQGGCMTSIICLQALPRWLQA